MKIDSSIVEMNSERSYSSYERHEMMVKNAPESEGLSEKLIKRNLTSGKSAVDDMRDYIAETKKEKQEQQKLAQANSLKSYLDSMRESRKANNGEQYDFAADKDGKIQMLKKLLAMLNGKKFDPDEFLRAKELGYTDMRSSNIKLSSGTSIEMQAQAAGLQRGTTTGGTVWEKVTASSTFFAESEHTTFATTGVAKTSDGRSISFNVEVNMSRGFMQQTDSITSEKFIVTDPLMINLDGNVASVSDFKIGFDIDSDGKEDKISFAGKGSGFIALDRNGDGVINDGSELFGTQSGDGFADLAAFDEDGNGWIDENDSIYDKLRIWTKDEDGKDHLDTLKTMDVGAIYLGNTGTEFSLKDAENNTNAIVRKTGIYLKESGGVGTVNHIDLAK